MLIYTMLGHIVTWTGRVDEQLLTVPGDWSNEDLVSRIHRALERTQEEQM